MTCGGLKGPFTGKPIRLDSDGNVPVSVESTVGTKPASWSASAVHSSPITDDGSDPFVNETPGRVYIRMTNTGPNDVFIRPGSNPDTGDTPLLVDQSIEFHGGYAGEWYGIAASGESATIAIIEFVT